MSAEATKALLDAVITIISIILSAYVIPYIKQRIDADRLARIRDYAGIAVRCAEQIFSHGDNKGKRNFVREYILSKAQAMGLDISEKDIELLLESAVNQLGGQHVK